MEMVGTYRGWTCTQNPFGQWVLNTNAARNTSVCRDAGLVGKVIGRTAHGYITDSCSGGNGSFVLPTEGLYRYKGICEPGQSNYSYNKHGGGKGFFVLTADKIEDLTEQEAQQWMVDNGIAELQNVATWKRVDGEWTALLPKDLSVNAGDKIVVIAKGGRTEQKTVRVVKQVGEDRVACF